MKKLILFLMLALLCVTNAYAYSSGTAVAASVAVGSAAAIAAENAKEIEQAKEDNDNVQIGIALCNQMLATNDKSNCLIELKNKMQKQKEDREHSDNVVTFWCVVATIATIAFLFFVLS